MRYLSVCSGMEAASVAWHHLGWKPVGFSEIEPFPCAILKHHFSQPNYPYDVPNYGSLTEFQSWPLATGDVDLLVGGTPCQSFSVAGKRGGLNDPRGQLMFSFLELAAKLQPKYVLWENVPGALSSGQPKGSDFGCLLQGLVERGYGVAYRILDAQHFGVPQRRRRVFVVAHRDPVTGTGDWRAAAEILSIAQGLRGYLAKGKQARKGSSADAESGAGADRKWPADTACTLNAAFGEKQGLEDQHALGGASLFVMPSGQANAAISKDVAHTLNATHETQTVAMPVCATGEKTHCLTASSGKGTTEDGTGRGTPIVIDRAAFNQGENAQYEPHIGESEVMDSLVARGPHAVGIPAMMFKIRGGSPVETGEQGGTPGKGAGKGFLGSEEKAFTIATSPDQWLAQPIISPTVTTCKGSRGGSSQEAIDEITAVHLAQQAIPIQDGREMEKNQNGIGVGKEGDPAYTIDTTGAQAIAIQGTIIGRSENAGPQGTGATEGGPMFTLTKTDIHGVCHQMPGSVAPTIGASGPPYSRTGNERVEAEALAITFQPGNLCREAGADPSFTTTTTLKASAGDQSPHVATIYENSRRDALRIYEGTSPTLQSFMGTGGCNVPMVRPAMAVRRLTPVECERLQGFPDNWSRISWKGKPETECPDGPRYKACGNSMAVPVMRWIGERIAAVDATLPSNA